MAAASAADELSLLAQHVAATGLASVDCIGRWHGYQILMDAEDEGNEAAPVSIAGSAQVMMATFKTDTLKFSRTNNQDNVFFLRHIAGVPPGPPAAAAAGGAAGEAAGEKDEALRKRLARAHAAARAGRSGPVVGAGVASRTVDSLEDLTAFLDELEPFETGAQRVAVSVLLNDEDRGHLLDARSVALSMAADAGPRAPIARDSAEAIRSAAADKGLSSKEHLALTHGHGVDVPLLPSPPGHLAGCLRALSRYFWLTSVNIRLAPRARTLAKISALFLGVIADDLTEVRHIDRGHLALSACAYATVAWTQLRHGNFRRPIGDNNLSLIQSSEGGLGAGTASMWLPAGSSLMDSRVGTAPRPPTRARAAKRSRESSSTGSAKPSGRHKAPPRKPTPKAASKQPRRDRSGKSKHQTRASAAASAAAAAAARRASSDSDCSDSDE